MLNLALLTGIPAWVQGSAIVLDFANNRYWGGSLNSLLSFLRNSTATYFNNKGLLQIDGVDIPRVDYNYTNLTSRGFLNEIAATNIQTFSNDLSNSAWTKNGIGTGVAPTITTAYATAPDGTMTANRVQMSLGGTPSSAFSRVFGNASAASGISSIWLKSNDGTNHILYLVGGFSQRRLITITQTWQRFSGVTYSSNATEFGLSGAAGTDTSADILEWGGGYETRAGIICQYANCPGYFPTSTIPTAGSSVARAVDVPVLAGAAAAAAAAGWSVVNWIDEGTQVEWISVYKPGAFVFPQPAWIKLIKIFSPGIIPPGYIAATVYFDGNSLTVGQNASGPTAVYPYVTAQLMAVAGKPVTGVNNGVGGLTTPQMNLGAALTTDPAYRAVMAAKKPFIDVTWELCNDILLNNLTSTQAYNNYVTYATARRALGEKVIVLTGLKRAGVSGWSGANETARLAANALIVADGTNWDGVVDVASISQLQDPTNTTYFGSDQIHLTDAGYALVANNVAPAVEGLIP